MASGIMQDAKQIFCYTRQAFYRGIEDSRLPRCDVAKLDERSPTFRKNTLPPFPNFRHSLEN